MITFLHTAIKIATTEDAPAITALLNSAYRGETSKKGWTTEAHLIAGNIRSNEQAVLEVMQQRGSIFLKYINEQKDIVGCVNLQQQEIKIYLGMFAVAPLLQGGGVGKYLLAAAEEYATFCNCNSIYMTVISVRTELINWYIKNGYKDTGQRKPFVEDGRTGTHLQPLEFMTLEKQIL
jgi:ribosomal protein S18 acetylase RimI-like enzyme